jgi:hypothetical protein
MDRIKITQVSQSPKEVVVGHNYELADMCNPEGTIFETRHFICAITDNGSRYWLKDAFSEDKANTLLRQINAHGSINPSLWFQGDSVYGSPAWEAEDNCRAMAHAVSPMARTIRDW